MLCSPLEFLFQSVLFAVINSASMTWNCVRVRFRWKTTRKLMLIKRVCTKIGKDEVRLIPPLWSAKEFPECFASWWLRDKEQDQFRKHCENCETALNPGIPCIPDMFWSGKTTDPEGYNGSQLSDWSEIFTKQVQQQQLSTKEQGVVIPSLIKLFVFLKQKPLYIQIPDPSLLITNKTIFCR